MSTFVFSSESVTEGHPDKIADQISDAVLDAVMRDDPEGRVACETYVTTGLVLVGGEITTSTYVDIPDTARGVIKSIGYTDASYGFDYETCAVITTIDKQSLDIAKGVDRGGAGDQGMMFGYACRDTEEMMPLPIVLAHRLTRRLADVRRSGQLVYLRPDGKAQVSVEFEDRQAKAVDTIVVSCQHEENVYAKDLAVDVAREIVRPSIPEALMAEGYTVLYNHDNKFLVAEKKGAGRTRIFVNPSGCFVTGGPQGDAGLTGRKIIVDTYGGWVPHGGGAFSGKDPTKVDRSGAYAARWVAKNVVAAGLADECTIQIAYAIGVAEPVSLMVKTNGTGRIPDSELESRIRRVFDLTPRGIIEALNLRRPIYRETATYGHFGRTGENFTWEKTDRIGDLI